jgi:hypothetical protein
LGDAEGETGGATTMRSMPRKTFPTGERRVASRPSRKAGERKPEWRRPWRARPAAMPERRPMKMRWCMGG